MWIVCGGKLNITMFGHLKSLLLKFVYNGRLIAATEDNVAQHLP